MKLFKINRLILSGPKYKRTLEFDDGFNIIRGERTSGKSLVLNLIDYCMGKSEAISLKVQKQLNLHCDQIFLEIQLNGETFTLNRFLKEKTGKISMYFCDYNEIGNYTPKVADIPEIMTVLIRKLNINEYKRTKYKAHSNEQTLETISLRDILRYVYIKQHSLGTDGFLDNNSTFKKYKNPYAFEMIFGLVEADKNQLQEHLIKSKNLIEKYKKEINGLGAYLEDKGSNNFPELMEKSNKIESNIKEEKLKKKQIIEEGSSINESENEMYVKLKNKLIELVNNISDFEKQKREILLSIESKNFLLNEYEQELKDTEVTVEVNYHLDTNNQLVECPLCHSKVKHRHDDKRPAQKVLKSVQNDIKSKSKLVEKLISKDKNRLVELETNIISYQEEKSILENAINTYSKQTSVPYLSHIESINTLINNYDKKKEMIDEDIRMHNKITEMEKHIEELKKTIKRIEKDLANLQVSEDYRRQVFSNLNDYYKSYMSRLKYDTSNTYISEIDYLPYHDEANVFEHESGGLLECMQISYLSSILQCKKDGFAIGHPGFLLLDSLSKYIGTNRSDEDDEEIKGRINDPEIYEEIYRILIELSNDFQMIVVDNTPPSKYTKFTKYTFLSGDEGLVNVDVNEFDER